MVVVIEHKEKSKRLFMIGIEMPKGTPRNYGIAYEL